MKQVKAKKMLRVLEKVQKICKRQERCEGCVFGKIRGTFAECMLDDPPANWNLEITKKRMLESEESTKGNTDGER